MVRAAPYAPQMLTSRHVALPFVLCFSVACSDDPATPTSGATNTTAPGTMTTGAATTGAATTGAATTGAATTGTTDAGTTGAATTGAGGTGSGTDGGTTGAPAGVLPADESSASIAAFIQAQSFTDASWTSIHAMPTEVGSGSHDSARAYFSPALVEFRTNNTDLNVAPDAPGVMAVKEMYDDMGAVVGYAVIYYPREGDHYYWCYGPAGRCASTLDEIPSDTPIWGPHNTSGEVSSCSFCHNGNIFTTLP